jgi:uncharacterized protein (DUF952 family)
MILHLVSKTEWDAKPADQPYTPDAFARDGFIHCTQGDDLMLQVANNFYRNVPGEFLALSIDEKKVNAEVKWEAASSPATPSAPAPANPAGIEAPPEARAEFGDAAGSPAPSLPSSPAPLFPHIYGPLNRDAIVEMRQVTRAADGAFTGFAPLDTKQSPTGMNLKTPSQLANELVDATGEFSDALARYKDRVQARMDELDKNIKDRLGE